MHVDEVELRVIRLPYKRPFKTSFGAETEKVAVIVDRAHRRRRGLRRGRDGHAAAVPRGDDRRRAAPAARGAGPVRCSPDGCDDPSTLGRPWTGWRGNPMAKTALELAVWDCYARQQDVPLRTLLGGERTEIPVGASLGMNPVAGDRGVGRPPRRRGIQADQAEDRAGLGLEHAGRGARRLPRHRADRRRQLGVHARRHRRAAQDRRVRAALHRAAAALGRPRRPRRAGAAAADTPICLDETLTSPARTRPRSTSARARSSTSRSAGSAGWRRPSGSTSCASSAACRCGAAACSRPASAGPTTSTSPRCPASCTRATPRRPAAPTPATSPSRHSRRPTGSCRCRRAGHRRHARPGVPRRGHRVGGGRLRR